jgi:hypothetical protein
MVKLARRMHDPDNVLGKPGRKLLVASLGVAALSYVGCGNGPITGNLIAPPGDAATDAATDAPPSVGNLVAPPPADAAPPDAPGDAPTAGNLLPPPVDAR